MAVAVATGSRLSCMWREPARQKSTYVYFDAESRHDQCRIIYIYIVAKASATYVDLVKRIVMFLFLLKCNMDGVVRCSTAWESPPCLCVCPLSLVYPLGSRIRCKGSC